MLGEVWTPERVELLKKLWAGGETANVIAVRLGGLTRSAVLGKVFRLRLGLDSVAAVAQKAQKLRAPEKHDGPPPLARRHRSSKRLNRPEPAPIIQHKSLLELTNDTCRWPHGRPGTKNFFFCGAPEADLERGIPYCARHMRRAYGITVCLEGHESEVLEHTGPSSFAAKFMQMPLRDLSPAASVLKVRK